MGGAGRRLFRVRWPEGGPLSGSEEPGYGRTRDCSGWREDEDQGAVVTDAGQLGPSIREPDDTAASSFGGVTGRSEDRAGTS